MVITVSVCKDTTVLTVKLMWMSVLQILVCMESVRYLKPCKIKSPIKFLPTHLKDDYECLA